jgi:hypothetical protein
MKVWRYLPLFTDIEFCRRSQSEVEVGETSKHQAPPSRQIPSIKLQHPQARAFAAVAGQVVGRPSEKIARIWSSLVELIVPAAELKNYPLRTLENS